MNLSDNERTKPMILDIIEQMRLQQRVISQEEVVYAAVKTMRDMLLIYGTECEMLFFSTNEAKHIS